jgi:hypothetical protein
MELAEMSCIRSAVGEMQSFLLYVGEMHFKICCWRNAFLFTLRWRNAFQVEPFTGSRIEYMIKVCMHVCMYVCMYASPTEYFLTDLEKSSPCKKKNYDAHGHE